MQPTPQATTDGRADDPRTRMRAGLVSLIVGTCLLIVKFAAYRATGSSAILSDAMESIVNVVAALFALSSLRFAVMPADRNHPYGHGKIEFFSAAFEGGLIAFAAVMIIYQGGEALWLGVELARLDLGVALTAAAGLANLGLGMYLVRVGRRHQSLTLIADGQHVLSDFWTSLGVVVGLVLVRFTGLVWVDPVIAIAVGINLAWTGAQLVRYSAGGLLDEEDVPLLERLLAAMNSSTVPGIIRIHSLRAIRSGRFNHVDAHLVVPEFWSVKRTHDAADAFEQRIIAAGRVDGEVVFHLDPCGREFCGQCDLADCPVRIEAFRTRTPLTLDEAVRTDPPRDPVG
jgi:cation diffusion facilitator family transporter